jgi:hypothetical protein
LKTSNLEKFTFHNYDETQIDLDFAKNLPELTELYMDTVIHIQHLKTTRLVDMHIQFYDSVFNDMLQMEFPVIKEIECISNLEEDEEE